MVNNQLFLLLQIRSSERLVKNIPIFFQFNLNFIGTECVISDLY